MLLNSHNNKFLILIPALNPNNKLIDYIDELLQNDFSNIIVVNDGSSKEFDEIFKIIQTKCTVITHDKNMGKGKALKDGFKYIKNTFNSNDYIGIITVDSDGQHLVKDVIKIANQMKESKVLILGSRDFNNENVPKKSSFGNKTTSNVFKILYGIKINDTQTGLRGIPLELIDNFINLPGDRFEYETNMLIECVLKKIRICEVPITTVYIENNEETHFRPVQDSILIYWKLLNSFVKYSAVSLVSCLIDIVIFKIALMVLNLQLSNTILIIIATVIARIISSLVNYFLNKNISFNSNKNVKSTIVKYYILVMVQMFMSGILVSGIYRFIGGSEVIIKLIVDTILFIINYRIQRTIIFNK